MKIPRTSRRLHELLRPARFFVFAGFLALSASPALAADTVPARERLDAPGERIDLGGHRLHLLAMGEANDGPTVILDSGAYGFTPVWAWVQPRVAEFARVVAYDRPGLGWSDPLPGEHDALGVAQALHDALQAANLPGPYVLVGHSMGGLYVRVFADLYRDEIAGVVLVDASHPDQESAYTPEEVAAFRQQRAVSVQGAELLRQGNTMFSDGLRQSGAGLPTETASVLDAFVYDPTHLEGISREMAAWDVVMAQARATSDLADLPLQVVIAGATPDGTFNRLNMDLANLSSRGAYTLVSDADHFSIVLDGDDARHVVHAVRDMLEDIGD